MSKANVSSVSICAEQSPRPIDPPAISEKIGGFVNKLRLQRVSQDQAKAIAKRHNTPVNVQLRLPKCEPSIWNEIPAKARVTDIKFQSTQAVLLGSIIVDFSSLFKTRLRSSFPSSQLRFEVRKLGGNFETNFRTSK